MSLNFDIIDSNWYCLYADVSEWHLLKRHTHIYIKDKFLAAAIVDNENLIKIIYENNGNAH